MIATYGNERGARLNLRAVRLRRVFTQDRFQGAEEKICVRLRKDQGRAQFDDVVVRAIGPGKDAALAQAIHNVGRFFGRGFTSCAIAYEIETEEKSGTAHIAEEHVFVLEAPEFRYQVPSNAQGVVLQAFVF